ncbi:hypothetical protein [uncultured Victivallis sp.]|uniref:hypothetical protein n=1 Tax=uncultured Victivallis sp. TaxID=354118 RepID=UPI0025DEC06E|nr:hypothetical protein [uncultured Victivallis sp.]
MSAMRKNPAMAGKVVDFRNRLEESILGGGAESSKLLNRPADGLDRFLKQFTGKVENEKNF